MDEIISVNRNESNPVLIMYKSDRRTGCDSVRLRISVGQATADCPFIVKTTQTLELFHYHLIQQWFLY